MKLGNFFFLNIAGVMISKSASLSLHHFKGFGPEKENKHVEIFAAFFLAFIGKKNL